MTVTVKTALRGPRGGAEAAVSADIGTYWDVRGERFGRARLLAWFSVASPLLPNAVVWQSAQ